MLVLDANILIRAVLRSRVLGLLRATWTTDRVEFYLAKAGEPEGSIPAGRSI